jgi:FixJ family two-component response regulator
MTTGAGQDNSTILVIDDEAYVRKSLSRLLRSLEFNVETYESAGRFLEWENYRDIGCIILDVEMPGLHGMDLHDLLIRAGYDLPIVFVSGYNASPMSVQDMKKSAVDFISKPFDEKELLVALERAIDKGRNYPAT